MDDWKHDHLGNQIIILSNQVKHYLHQAAEVEGISGSQSRILHYISEFSKKTEVYQKDVEEFFYLRRSTVTQTLQTMEKNGLIKRSSVARDARLKKLELTGAGQALEEKIHTRVMQMEQRLRDCLSEEEITQFLSITDKLGAELTSLGAPEIKQACK
ncbi:MAG: MarR family transcriptional regulator [Lachnospiraceae bacterium]|nr:MarR family transcriptional regulator [Lachnospiraceae bacterium]